MRIPMRRKKIVERQERAELVVDVCVATLDEGIDQLYLRAP